MDLSSAFQVVLFVLPGFAAWRFYSSFVPSRRSQADAEVIIGSIMGSAGIWVAASIVVILASWALNWVTSRRGGSWSLDLWTLWLAPSLGAHQFGLRSLAPGMALTVAAVIGGTLAAQFVRGPGGALRVFQLGPLRYDPNPRVWSWFLATERGALFRVTLTSGKVLIGQIAEYSTDPTDDVLEIVMQEYAIADDATAQLKDPKADTVLVWREDIELIERLPYPLEPEPDNKAEATALQVPEPSALRGRSLMEKLVQLRTWLLGSGIGQQVDYKRLQARVRTVFLSWLGLLTFLALVAANTAAATGGTNALGKAQVAAGIGLVGWLAWLLLDNLAAFLPAGKNTGQQPGVYLWLAWGLYSFALPATLFITTTLIFSLEAQPVALGFAAVGEIWVLILSAREYRTMYRPVRAWVSAARFLLAVAAETGVTAGALATTPQGFSRPGWVVIWLAFALVGGLVGWRVLLSFTIRSDIFRV